MFLFSRRFIASCRSRQHIANIATNNCSRPNGARRAISTDTRDPEYQKLLEGAQNTLANAGFDPSSFREQKIVWGDQDAFQHVNNVRYIRFFESARIQWMMSLGEEWGGPEKAQNMVKGKGLSLILGSIDVQFRHPVTFPDTLLFGYCPLIPKPHAEASSKFQVVATGYSLKQQDYVVFSKETLVWYDYDALKKGHPPPAASDVVFGRAKDIDLRALTRHMRKVS